MAEVVGLVASVLALVQLAGQVTAVGYGYIGGVKRASKDLEELSRELSALSLVLISLQKYVDSNPQSSALQALNVKDGPLKECDLELKALLKKLEPKDGFKGVIHSLKWPLKEAETFQHISRIERQKSLFIFALTADHISLTREIEAYVRDTNHVVKEIHTMTVALTSWTKKEDTLRIDQHRKEVLAWLFSADFDTKHLETRNKRQRGTGAWLLKEPIFLEWLKKQPKFRLLCGYGIPGAGKTFLSSVVIDHLEAQASVEKIGVAYIYFNYKEQHQQGPVRVLASIVKQLACQLPHLPLGIGELYGRLASEEKKPTLDDLYTVLLSISKSFTQTYIVADALDECSQEDQRKELLPLFHRIGKNGVSLFLTSRHHPEDIQDSFRNVARIELSAKKEDIRLYIQQKIDESARSRRLIQHAKLQDRIVPELVDCANGMFLLVHFYMEYICAQTSPKGLLNVFSSLKKASKKKNPLDPTYKRIMENIREQPENCMELALDILSWLVKTRRVLTVDEIQTAIAVEPDRYELDELDLTDRDVIVDVCAGLVTIDESDNIRLVHYTVQEYLVQNSIIPTDADFKTALTCITYLSFDTFDKPCTSQPPFDERLRLYPFLNYTSRYLKSHLEVCDESLTVDPVFQFLEKQGHILSYLQALNNRDTHGLENVLYWGAFQEVTPPLHVAAKLGHCAAFQRLLDDGADIWALDGYKDTVLHYAAMAGSGGMARLILDKGVPVSIIGKFRRTALAVAAEWGNEEVAQVLIENGADVLAKDWGGGTVTGLAAAEGRDAVMKLLLENGADPSVPDGEGFTPLHFAASRGHEGIFELVIQKINVAGLLIKDQNGKNVLDLALDHERDMMARKIIEKGIDLSAKDERGRTALHIAAFRDCAKIIQFMLERGADVSATDTSGKTALDIAISMGHEAVVMILEVALKQKAEKAQAI